jgi:hypothetical protein
MRPSSRPVASAEIGKSSESNQRTDGPHIAASKPSATVRTRCTAPTPQRLRSVVLQAAWTWYQIRSFGSVMSISCDWPVGRVSSRSVLSHPAGPCTPEYWPSHPIEDLVTLQRRNRSTTTRLRHPRRWTLHCPPPSLPRMLRCPVPILTPALVPSIARGIRLAVDRLELHCACPPSEIHSAPTVGVCGLGVCLRS